MKQLALMAQSSKLCGICGAEKPSKESGKNSSPCIACRNKRMKDHRSKRIAAGLCWRCGVTAPPDMTQCRPCSERVNANSRRSRKNAAAKGLCVYCRSFPIANGSKSLCLKHLQEARTRSKDAKEKASVAGFCVRCMHEPAVAGKNCVPCWFKVVAKSNLGSAKHWHVLKNIWDHQSGVCALTGEVLRLGDGASVDHIVPVSKGGTNDISNLRWVTSDSNYAKRNLSDEAFLDLCRKVVAIADAKAATPKLTIVK